MAIHKLTALSIQKIYKRGLYSDGGGLYLQVSMSGSKSWVFRYKVHKRPRMMGLGSLNAVSLSRARDLATDCRRILAENKDPIDLREEKVVQEKINQMSSMTFEKCAASYISTNSPAWRNPKHRLQWERTLSRYAYPVIGEIPVSRVDTAMVMRAIEPIWLSKTETASRLRNRIELVLSWATVRGYRKGDNPARWQGHLDQLLPKRSKVQPTQHFQAMPYREIGDFMAELREIEGSVARAMEFTILCASRSSEVFGAKFSEVDLSAEVWTIPGSRMKAARDHRVPLSARAVEIIREMQNRATGDYLFPGRLGDQPLSSNALLALLKKRMNLKVTAHGFRSTFRDWAGECTNHPREVVEMSLAHVIKDATEAAYMRGDLLLKRRVLMADWANYCLTRSPKPSSVAYLGTSIA